MKKEIEAWTLIQENTVYAVVTCIMLPLMYNIIGIGAGMASRAIALPIIQHGNAIFMLILMTQLIQGFHVHGAVYI